MTTTNAETSENEELTLYKFRSLGSCEHLEYAEEILEDGTFWCSHFGDLNDPMEGVYRLGGKQQGEHILQKIYSEKNKISICSFSGKNGFKKPADVGILRK